MSSWVYRNYSKFLCYNIIDILIGFDQQSYTVNEADGSVRVCVVLLMNSGMLDSTVSADATLSAADGTAIGIETLLSV